MTGIHASRPGKVLLLLLLVVLVLGAGGYVGIFMLPGSQLQAADQLAADGLYTQAMEAYTALSQQKLLGVTLSGLPFGPARSAAERCSQAQYQYAEALLAQGSYDEASGQFAALGSYKDAAERVGEPYYAQGELLLAQGQYAQAADAFHRAGSYRDAAERIAQVWYQQAEELLAQQQYDWASDAFFAAGDYKDAARRVDEPFYRQGEALLGQQQYTQAAAAFDRAGGYEDAAQASTYCKARALLAQDKLTEALPLLEAAGSFADAPALAQTCRQAIEKDATLQSDHSVYTTSGQLVTFGRYEQDGDSGNGKEPLTWRVLEAGEGYALLVTEKIIAMQPYTDQFIVVTWENSSLRQWLLTTFLSSAFTAQERQQLTTLARMKPATSAHGAIFDATGGDLVTMLTEPQVRALLPDGAAAAQATPFALRQGVAAQEDGFARYWLCLPDYDSDDALTVSPDGLVDLRSLSVDTRGVGVRPVICLNLELVP